MRKICGVVVNDCPGWSSKPLGSYERRVYKLYQNMITRCYNLNYQDKNNTYVGCTVCERWLTL